MEKKLFHNELQTPRRSFWQGSQTCLLRVQGIYWGKRVILKSFFCSLFRNFSVDFVDLRQTFWQVVRTVKNFIQSSFWGKYFRGHSSMFVPFYLNIQQKALFLTKFLGMIIKSALHVSKGTILELFVFYEHSTFYSKFCGGTNKIFEFRSGFLAQFQNYSPRDQRETLRISTFFEIPTIYFSKSKLEGNIFGWEVETGHYLSRQFFEEF